MAQGKISSASGSPFVMHSRRRVMLLLAAAFVICAAAAGWRLVAGMAAPQPLQPGASTSAQPAQPAQPAQAAQAAQAAQQAADRAVDPVSAAQAQLRQRPDDPAAYAMVGLALLQKVRESYDTTLYAKAAAAFDAALQRDPQQIDALVGRGTLALALHDFRGALPIADEVIRLNPYRAAGYGIRVDALVELGRYAEAVAAAQQMVDLRPDLESYSRVSYLRELHGDPAGAIEAMRMAAATAVPGSEPWLWTTTHLGNLYWGQGDLDAAEQIYRAVLRRRADYAYAQFGMARIDAARGHREQAISILQPLAARLPLPEFLIALGDLHAGQGDEGAAQEQYDLVRVIQQLNAGAGMNVDLELAAFDVQHGDDVPAALAAARVAYAERPTVYAADTLAWALHRSGDDAAAWRYSQEALRLGTQDPLLHLHAAAIADSLGDAPAAERHWAQAEDINPYYSAWK